MTPYLESIQRDVRRAAMRAVHQAYLDHREEFESILTELVDTRIALARANGFDRYVDYINLEKGRHGYGQQELLAFCEQVKRDLVPLYAELNRRQAGRLGLTKLASYDADLIFPDGNAKPIGDGPTLLEAAKEMYDQLGEEIGGLYREMADHGYIDVTASPHKITGMGFCDALHTLKIPYIFGNCNGSIHDTTTLTHEMGHAYQMWLCMNRQPVPDFVDMPNDVVQIPSKAMEQFTAPFAELFFDDGDKFRYHHTQYVVREICAFCAIHEYEDWLYAHPGAAPAERASVFLQINRTYSPGIDDTEMEDLTQQGSALFRSMGVYMFPGYLISYALSDMGALEFRVRAEEDFPAAWADYRALCMAGGSLDYGALLRAAHLSTAYAPGTVARAADCLRKALK